MNTKFIIYSYNAIYQIHREISLYMVNGTSGQRKMPHVETKHAI